MKIKENIDLIGKKIDIIKSKSLGFMAMAGGSFVYAIKVEISYVLNIGIWIVFALSVYGIIVNLKKFGNLYYDLERIENDTI